MFTDKKKIFQKNETLFLKIDELKQREVFSTQRILISKKKSKTIYLGLQLLKMLLCFWVVFIHIYKTQKPLLIKLFFQRKFHVPGFIIISFYFLYKIISKRDIDKAKQRLERLLIPYIIIPLIIWIINNLLYIYFHFNMFGRKLLFKELIYQYIIGYKFYLIFWFQFIILIITLFFFIITFAFNKHFLIIIQVLGFISYIFQYSGYNLKLFSKYNSLGNIAEIIPNSVIGLSFGSINLIDILQKYRLRAILISYLFLYLLFKYNIFNTINGFFYPGMLHTFGGIFLFILFSLIPFENIKNRYIILTLKVITNYTGGIYYYHILIRDILVLKMDIIECKNIKVVIFIYLLSYFGCFIGSKIFGRTRLKYLFN